MIKAVLFVLLALVAAGFVVTQLIVARAISTYPPSGVFIDVTGGRLHLRDMGPRDAPPEKTLVLIHGASCNHKALLEPLQSFLGDRYRIIAIDRPGHGFSDRPGGREDANPVRQAALVNEALEKLGVSKAIVMGHSFGGAIATTFAMDHPGRTVGLVLLAPVTHPWPGGIAWYYGPASTPWIGWMFSNIIAAPGATVSMPAALESVFHPQKVPDRYEQETALKLLLRPQNFMANAQDVSRLLQHVKDRAGTYKAIKAPVVIISGDQDKTVSTTIHSMALKAELPEAKLIVLPNVGHIVQYADPALVVSELDALSDRLKR